MNRKFFRTGALAAVFTLLATSLAFAGPADDPELLARAAQVNVSSEAGQAPASGPSAGVIYVDGAQAPAEGTAQPQAPQEAAPQPAEAAQPAAQTQQGAVASGGRTIDPAKPMIALTFDDGPYAKVGNRIMDAAEAVGGRVTFYVVGERVPSYATEIRRMHDNGHEIGNHTQNHKYLNKLDAAGIQAQVAACQNAVAAITGSAPKTMRLPGGNRNATVLANVNMPIVLWNVDTLDWKHRNAQTSIDTIMNNAKDGDVILMHELYDASGDAACNVIPHLAAKGFQLVTVSELASFRGGLQNGKVYYSFK